MTKEARPGAYPERHAGLFSNFLAYLWNAIAVALTLCAQYGDIVRPSVLYSTSAMPDAPILAAFSFSCVSATSFLGVGANSSFTQTTP
jgi:hypothetical protein